MTKNPKESTPAEMSVRAYAKRVGVDEKAIRQAINKGLIFEGFDLVKKKIIVAKADEEYGQIKEMIKPQRGVSRSRAIESNEEKEASPNKNDETEPDEKPISKIQKKKLETMAGMLEGNSLLAGINITNRMKMGEAMRLREILALALDKKKLEEAERVLVRRDDVNKTLFNFANELKKSLFSIPAKVVSHIQSAGSELEGINILNDELTHVLNMYAKTEVN